ncbi:MAG TPA: phage tail tip lysozyme [Candidatus Saccharimonadales bacterium]
MTKETIGESRGERRVFRRGVLFYGAAALAAAVGATGASGSGCGSTTSAHSSVSCPSDRLANVKTSYQFFYDRLGRDHNAAVWSAGDVGNLMQESYACIDPSVDNGIAQWTDQTRNEAFNNYIAEHGDGLVAQLNFSWDEYNDKIPGDHQGHALSELKKTSDVDAAALSVSEYYEGCGDCENGQREQYAEEVYADAQKDGWN